MNTIKGAFAKAGVKSPPQASQIWSYLKANPDKTSKEVSEALKITYASSSSLLSAMQNRGSVSTGLRANGTQPVRGNAPKIYKTEGSGYKYVKPLLPPPPPLFAKPQLSEPIALGYVAPKVVQLAPPVEHHVHAAAQAPAARSLDDLLSSGALDRYKLGELRRIYAYLDRIFAGERLHVSQNLTKGMMT